MYVMFLRGGVKALGSAQILMQVVVILLLSGLSYEFMNVDLATSEIFGPLVWQLSANCLVIVCSLLLAASFQQKWSADGLLIAEKRFTPNSHRMGHIASTTVRFGGATLIANVIGKFDPPRLEVLTPVLSEEDLVTQHFDPPPHRAIGYSYTYRIYVFQVSQGIALYPPPSSGYGKIMLRGHGG